LRAAIDVLIVGGGLAGGLAAWRLATARPELNALLLERGSTLGGNHTWSFHDTDIPAAAQQWLEPLIAARWPGHEVRFSGTARELSGGYASITSDRFHAVIRAALGDRVRFNCDVASVGNDMVTLASGDTIRAAVVIDARGGGIATSIPCGWQTFLGQELILEGDHGVHLPILMDATVPQDGGFRFVYVLPWTSRRLLVEDTLYADVPAIDADDRRNRIAQYAIERGWTVQQVSREEQGALPIPLSGDIDDVWGDDTNRIGVRSGLFHPTTGYSLADAVATASLLSEMPLDHASDVLLALKDLAFERWSTRAFFRLLNRMLFIAAEPESRVNVLEQFYRRPEPLIARFYAAQLSRFDRWRLLAGRPPVPLGRALAQLRPVLS
jgi:lycopene beta-cyclase